MLSAKFLPGAKQLAIAAAWNADHRRLFPFSTAKV